MTAFSKNTYSFPLDIKRRTGVKLLGVNGDTANRFIVTLQDAGVNLDLTGLYVRAVFRRSDGVTVLQSESDSPANITKTTGGVVTIDVLNGSFRDGDNDMEIQVLDGDPDTGDVLITSARMLFRVRKELNSDDATESSHEYTVLQQFIDGLGNMTVTVETLAAGSSATAGLIVGDDYSYELALGIPRGADGSDGVGIANIQALESIIDGSYSLKIVMTDSTIYTFPLPFYIKPAGGIPKTDLAAGVQASLGKADSALQQHQSLAGYATQTWVGQQGYLTEHQDLSAYRTASDQDAIDDAQDAAIAAKYTKPSGGIPTSDIANGAVTGYKIGDHEVTPDKLGEMEALRILGNNSLSPTNVKELTGAQVTAMLAAMSGASASSAGGKGLVPPPVAGDNVKFLRGDGSWQAIANMVGASSSAAGAAGLVPAPASGDQTKFLCGDGTWKAAGSASRSDVFIATFDTTTMAELTAAMNAGKTLGVKFVYASGDTDYGIVYTAWLNYYTPGNSAGTYEDFHFITDTILTGGKVIIIASNEGVSTAWTATEEQADDTPSDGSTNLVTSGGVYAALAEINQKLVGAMKFIGAKATTSELPSTGNTQGDVWHITADGSEWAWTGSAWENLGKVVDISGKQDTISDLDAIRSGAAAGATAVQPAALTAYRTASAQDEIDGAQDAAIAGKLAASGTAYKSASIPMGAVDSSSTATVFTATIDGITALRDGVCMWLTNGVITSAEGFTININNLGAKPVYGSLAAATASTTVFNKNYTMLFIYNSSRVSGGCWDIVYGYDSNTTYTPIKLGFGYTTCSTAAATAAKTASLSSYALNTGGIVAVKFDNAVPANATLNINSKGAKAIYYKGAAITSGVIKAGDTVTFMYSTQYHVLSIDRDEAPVTSVNGSTGDVTLTAADVGATPETFLVTVTASNGSYSADKTFAEISAAYAAGKILLVTFPFDLNGDTVYTRGYLYPVGYASSLAFGFSAAAVNTDYHIIVSCTMLYDSTVYVAQEEYERKHLTATINIATTDWSNNSCTEYITGMTADAMVFVEFSDTTTEFSVTQSNGFLTITASTTPSAAVTVKVGWLL